MMTGKTLLRQLKAMGLATVVVLLMAGCHDGAQMGSTTATAGSTTPNGPESPVAAQPDSPAAAPPASPAAPPSAPPAVPPAAPAAAPAASPIATTPSTPGVTPPPPPTTPSPSTPAPEPTPQLEPASIPSVTEPAAEPRIDVALPADRDGDGLADGDDPAPAMRPFEGMEFAFGPKTTNGREDPQVVLVPPGDRAVVAWVEDGRISLSIFNIQERRYELPAVVTPDIYTMPPADAGTAFLNAITCSNARKPRLAISPDGSAIVLLFKCGGTEKTLVVGEFDIEQLLRDRSFPQSFKRIQLENDVQEAVPLYLKGGQRALVWSERTFLYESYSGDRNYAFKHDSLFLAYFDSEWKEEDNSRIEFQRVDPRSRNPRPAPQLIDNWEAIGLADGSVAVSLQERFCGRKRFFCVADEKNLSGRTVLFAHKKGEELRSTLFQKDAIVLLGQSKRGSPDAAFEAAWWDYPFSAENTYGFSFWRCNYSIDAGFFREGSCDPFEYRAPLSLVSRLIFFDSLPRVRFPVLITGVNVYGWREEQLLISGAFQHAYKLAFFKEAGFYLPLADPIDLGNGEAIALAVTHDLQQANSLRYFVVKEDGSRLVAKFEHVGDAQ